MFSLSVPKMIRFNYIWWVTFLHVFLIYLLVDFSAIIFNVLSWLYRWILMQYLLNLPSFDYIFKLVQLFFTIVYFVLYAS